ncbi:MAG TPA: MarR family winged helix-turn-helix transcriptional regulator [Terriglobia bacterium]|nr:MarR family winged helix-turn-helix transcriptional regulator [Terriglobia bacterium]
MPQPASAWTGRASGTLETEAFLSLQRAADRTLRGVEQALAAAGLSPAQYNVLRILRGAVGEGPEGPRGLTCGEVASRMITRDPDVTRLFDRLEARGLVARSRDRKDRRVVRSRLTAEGSRLLATLDEPILELHHRQLGRLGKARLRLLIELLQRAAGSGPARANRDPQEPALARQKETTWKREHRVPAGA